jgi:small-conductance mechanosensitive channel
MNALAGLGLAAPAPRELGFLAVATALTIVAHVAGLLARRRFGTRAAAEWKARVGQHAEGIGPRLGAIVDHATSGVLLAVALKGYPWPGLTDLPLGLALAISVALLARQVLRGLSMPRWITWAVALVLFTAILSGAIGGLAPITDTLDRVGFDVGKRRFSLLALVTIMVTAVGLFAGVRLVNRALAHWIGRASSLDPTQKLLAQKLAAIAVIVAAFFIGIDLLDIDLTAFAVFSGALGLAVGFGLQKTFGNLIAGIILLLDRSIKPGDVIVIGDAVGQVNKIGVRAVSIVTRDGKEHLIPNENLMTQEVENWSYSDRNVRVRVKVNVDYACDVELAQQLMLQAATDSPRVLDNPKPTVWLTGLGENAMQFEIRVWISDPESGLGNMTSDVLTRVVRLFRENGIGFPYPQRDIHLRSWPDSGPRPTP